VAASIKVVALLGTGLIGGSIGLGLRRLGMIVRGYDHDPTRRDEALTIGAADETGDSVPELVDGVDLVVVAVPVGRIAEVVVGALDAGAPVVTDVGSVKAPIVAEVETARPELGGRFVGGHPMTGSEQSGLTGADADLFAGATWVLTPTGRTDASAFASVGALVGRLGSEVIATTPERHDELVAVVSHVPQLAATTLMDMAAETGEGHATLLRLAAGGFRDMTRIAAGDAEIWPDICIANRDAIVAGLDNYLAALDEVRSLVVDGDRGRLLSVLERARDARRNLPVGAPSGEKLAEVRVPVPDRPGVIAEVTTLAGAMGVNITDVEIAHSVEGGGGVLMLVVAARAAERLASALTERGYHTGWTELP